MVFFSSKTNAQITQTYDTPGTYTFTVPNGVTELTVECWGAGGGGGGNSSNKDGAGGGGGGGYSRATISVISEANYTVTVGAGGNGGTGNENGSSGGSSWFGNQTTILAYGGNGGEQVTWNGGDGGDGAGLGIVSGNNTVRYSGGNGAAGNNDNTGIGGGGGSSAGTSSNGNNASNGLTIYSQTGASAPAGGGNGADGDGNSGATGGTPGGGGSGAGDGNNNSGGNGGAGLVTITYTITTPPTCTTPVSPSDGAVDFAVDGTFTWDAAPGATGYKIYLGTDAIATNIENGTDLGNVTSYQPSANLNFLSDYYWKIVPYNSFGDASSCSVWSFTTADISYCNASFSNSSYEWISNVTFASINKNSGGDAGEPVDYTNLVAQVEQGGVYPISVSINADSRDYIYAFIDWNQNGNFNDADEVFIIASNTSSDGPHTLNINVPADANLGNTRMRVMVDWYNSNPDPCRNASYGEVEDYTVTVISSCDINTHNVIGGGSYCSGNAGITVGLDNSETGIVYTLYRDGTSTGISVTGSGSEITFGNQTLVGTYTVIGHNIAEDCDVEMEGSADVSINPLPVANFSSSETTITQGTSVNFSDLTTESPTSWTWNFSGGSPSISNSQNPTVTYNTTGTYTVTLTAYNACGSDSETKTGYITVTEQDPCSGTGIIWSEDFESYTTGTTEGSILNSSPKWTVSGAIDATFTVDGNLMEYKGSSSTTETEGIWTSQVINIAGYNDVSFSLIASTANTNGEDHEDTDYTDVYYSIDGGAFTRVPNWNSTYGDDNHTLINGEEWTPQTITVSGLLGNTLTIRVGMLNSVIDEQNRFDNVLVTGTQSAPTVDNPNNQIYNDGDPVSIIFSGTGATAYYWANNNINIGLGASGAGDLSFTATNSETTPIVANIEVTPSNGTCTGTPETFTITVNPGCPSPSIESETLNGATYCENETANQLSVTASGEGLHYQWYSNTSSSYSGGTLTGTDNPVYTPSTASEGTLFYYVIVSNDCSTDTSNISGAITVNLLPIVVANASSTKICTGESITLTGSGASTYVWDNGVSNGIPFTPTSTTTYTVTGTDVNGCANTDQITITVNPRPTLSNINQDASVCEGSSATINLGGLIPGTTFTLDYSINGIDQPSIENIVANESGNSSFATSALSAENDGQILEVLGILITSEIPGCLESFNHQITLNVKPLPVITTSGIIDETCFSDNEEITSLEYASTTHFPISYRIDWDEAANSAGLNDQSETAFTFDSGGGILSGIIITANTPEGTYNGTMTITNGNGCEQIQAVSVKINQLPNTSNINTN